MLITSTKNETVKLMRRLKERSVRRETGLHLIEGERLVFDALNSGAIPDCIFIEEGRTDIEARIRELRFNYVNVTRTVLEAVADTLSPQGIVASIFTPSLDPPEEYADGMFIALDALQDPGNLGTILRTADAMGASGVLLGVGCTDAFSPKALRAAMGSTYHMPIYQCDLNSELSILAYQNFIAICGHLQGEEKIPVVKERCVIVIGNEGNGVSNEIAKKCRLCRLPMYGKAESLNASVAASILIYEIAKNMKVGSGSAV